MNCRYTGRRLVSPLDFTEEQKAEIDEAVAKRDRELAQAGQSEAEASRVQRDQGEQRDGDGRHDDPQSDATSGAHPLDAPNVGDNDQASARSEAE